MSRTNQLAKRIAIVLDRLNQGERLDLKALATEFGTSLRTLQRDVAERLDFLAFEEKGDRFYKLDRQKSGYLTPEDIARFANFVSISNLFLKIDRQFFQEKLSQSIQIKGFQYEDIKPLEGQFNQIQKTIESHQYIEFNYKKSGQNDGKFYQIAPYALINKNGIWYLIGTENNKIKTFCFTQISMLKTLEETFIPEPNILQEIQQNDSIYLGNTLKEVVIKVSPTAAPYFLRRILLPNQKLVHTLDNGGLLLACENVNEQEIVPLVQYWIPHLTIISPVELQGMMIDKLQEFINSNSY